MVVERPSWPGWWRGPVGLGGGEAKWVVLERPSGPRWWRGQVGLGGEEVKWA